MPTSVLCHETMAMRNHLVWVIAQRRGRGAHVIVGCWVSHERSQVSPQSMQEWPLA
jgi:hypothetical protein